MARQVKEDAPSKLETVEMSELLEVSGGIWDYSNRLGILGQMLEDRQDAKYGIKPPKNLDEAANQVFQGWVSVP